MRMVDASASHGMSGQSCRASSAVAQGAELCPGDRRVDLEGARHRSETAVGSPRARSRVGQGRCRPIRGGLQHLRNGQYTATRCRRAWRNLPCGATATAVRIDANCGLTGAGEISQARGSAFASARGPHDGITATARNAERDLSNRMKLKVFVFVVLVVAVAQGLAAGPSVAGETAATSFGSMVYRSRRQHLCSPRRPRGGL